jgi:hypothetical protein
VLNKCANSICPTPFRRLSHGKLFRVERKAFVAGLAGLRPTRRSRLRRRVEHYWLCDQCSSELTLIFEKEHGMLTVPLPEANKRAPVAPTGAA